MDMPDGARARVHGQSSEVVGLFAATAAMGHEKVHQGAINVRDTRTGAAGAGEVPTGAGATSYPKIDRDSMRQVRLLITVARCIARVRK